jgi:hypothetical protein
MRLCNVCRVNPSGAIRYGRTNVFCSEACKSFYSRYLDMRRRATDPSHKQYKDYGGRGCGLSPEWSEFDGFRRHMLASYFHSVATRGLKATTLDRIDNDKGYSWENCRWTTPTVQTFNRRRLRSCRSKYIGVTFHHGKWDARITIGGKRQHLGTFLTEEEARDAYKAAFEALVRPRLM